jgi:hypothetical protein
MRAMPAGVLLTAQEAKEIGNLLLRARGALATTGAKMTVNGRYPRSGVGILRDQCNRSARKILGSAKTNIANGKR